MEQVLQRTEGTPLGPIPIRGGLSAGEAPHRANKNIRCPAGFAFQTNDKDFLVKYVLYSIWDMYTNLSVMAHLKFPAKGERRQGCGITANNG